MHKNEAVLLPKQCHRLPLSRVPLGYDNMISIGLEIINGTGSQGVLHCPI